MSIILNSLYFFLPAYAANMAPVLFKGVPLGNKPIHRRLFGENKTWRGLITATLTGTLVFYIQKILYAKGFTSLALIDYNGFSILLGFLLSFGAISGDVIKSYFKRKYNVLPGRSWAPWDQLDFVFGGILFGFFLYVPPVEVTLTLLLVSPLLHVLFSYLGYLLKLKRDKF